MIVPKHRDCASRCEAVTPSTKPALELGRNLAQCREVLAKKESRFLHGLKPYVVGHVGLSASDKLDWWLNSTYQVAPGGN